MLPLFRSFKFIVRLFVILMALLVIITYQNYGVRRRISTFQKWRKALESDNMKYILIWTKEEPDLEVLKHGQEAFIENKCQYSNCFVTKERNFTNLVYTNFDAIIISNRNTTDDLPEKRYADQMFIFASKESADNYPLCNPVFDDYYNVSWTYKLDSDIVWKYFTVLDKEGTKIAPSENPKWKPGLNNFSKKLGKVILRKKIHAVAWFASNCFTRSKREHFILKLRHALKWYGLDVHVVGSCGTMVCPVEKDYECRKILGRYYFYLAFENSLAEDYVSEKVVRPMLHYAVPVVYGGANYSRFLPPHSYINAKALGAKQTAAKIASLVINTTAYLEYFKWHNHYTINVTHDSVCTICEWLNKGIKKTHEDFRNWWNPANDTCSKRIKRTTIRNRILAKLLGSTCSLDETPYLVSSFRGSSIFSVNKAYMGAKHKEVRRKNG